MDESMKLVLGWTIVVAFVFTTAITCMSLIGWVTFAHKKQQYGLYSALIVELVVGSAGGATKAMRLDASAVSEELKTEGANQEISSVISDAVGGASGAPVADKEQLTKLVERIRVKPGTVAAQKKEDLRAAVFKLPAGALKASDVGAIRRADLLAPQKLTTPAVKIGAQPIMPRN